MSNLNRTISIKCPHCGGIEFERVEGALDTDFVKCAGCGLDIMLSDLRESGIAQAKDEVSKDVHAMVRKAFKGILK